MEKLIAFTLLVYLMASVNFKVTAGEAEAVIRFKRFVNPGGKGDNGNCCDGRSIFCEINGCDHFFQICLDNAQGSNSLGSCEFGRKSTDRVKNKDSITFGAKIGDTDNNFVFRLDTWPTSVKLKVKVEDKDKFNSNDYVDTLVSVLTQAPHPTETVPHTLRDRCTLQLEMEVRCLEYWWGEDCATYCRPRDSHSGHYNCSNNGTKICLPGWTGDRCDDEINECESSPCDPIGGTCEDVHNAFACICNQGYTGVTCSEDIDECRNDTLCSGNGECVNVAGSYNCNCSQGFTGDHCEENVDECLSSPCAHSNATCVDGVNSFTCLCPPGLTGELCEVDINECINHGCLNNATCVDRSGYYGCKCAPGYEGSHCETEIDECASSPCHSNTSRCLDNIDSYHCECSPGWTGAHCETEVNECESSPCIHGNCTDLVNDYICVCDAGFEGLFCDVNIDDCANVTCSNNNSYCVDRIDSYECLCIEGYMGQNCTEQTDQCQTDTCLNNGTCVQLALGYKCICDQKWNGTFCNESICASSPCSPVGSLYCVLNNGSYECICMDGWKGEYCDTQTKTDCLCPSVKYNKTKDVNVTAETRTCSCTNYTGQTDLPLAWDNVTDTVEEQSAILFVGEIDAQKCDVLVDFIRSYTTTVLPVTYEDVSVKYQLDSCKGEKGEDVAIFIFEMEVHGKRVPYSVVDTFFEVLLDDTRNMAHLPLRLYTGDDCYEADELVSTAEDSFPYWIIACVVVGVLLLLIVVLVVWGVRKYRITRLKPADDPVLVDHKARQSRLNSEALILSNEAVTDGFSPEGAEGQNGDVTVPAEGGTDLPDGSTDPDAQPTTPKCFVNLMYEDLPEVPKQE